MEGIKNLLLEIGTEELPSSCMIEGIAGLKAILEKNLNENRIDFEMVKTYATPRRLVAYVSGMAAVQKTEEKIVTGPPVKIAFDANGSPTAAATGFAKSLNTEVNRLQEIDTGKGVYLGLKVLEKGRPVIDVLPAMLAGLTTSINFSKQMTWGDYSIRFARPIRWVTALFGEEVVRFGIENLKSSDVTFSIRSLNKDPVTISGIKSIEDYIGFLKNKCNVILDPEERKKMILNSIKGIEEKEWKGKYRTIIDEGLLQEVVNLVEYPNVLIGNFPDEYLYIPRDILIKAIQHHQRYFAVVDESSGVTTKFVLVQNGKKDQKGEIVKGNERVLKARLSDARFFYEEDKKSSFEKWQEKLKGVIFYSGLGSLFAKSERLAQLSIMIISEFLTDGHFKIDDLEKKLKRASAICKCDLVTDLVVEFPELQGLVGREYAKEKGEIPEVAEAIFEHYLPRSAGDSLPDTATGSILSIADKIDTLAGMFIAGNMPSGSQDPFALRRKASGIILTAIKNGFNIDISALSDFAISLYTESVKSDDLQKDKVLKDLIDFILARYRFRLEKNQRRTDLFDAVIGAGHTFIVDIDARYNSLEEYLTASKDISAISEPLVRCKNIIKGKRFSGIIEDYLIEPDEKNLFKILVKKDRIVNKLLKDKKFDQILLELESLGTHINSFFDKVLVIDNDENIRNNRINLVKYCTDLYYLYADFSVVK